MTSTQSLSERLREFSVVVYNPDGSQGRIYPVICTQAADALDAQQIEIERLRTAVVWHCEACGTVTRSGNCDCTKMGTGTQRLVPYDYRASVALDALERTNGLLQASADTLREGKALVALAEAALEQIVDIGDASSGGDRGDLVASREIAREALAAIRASEDQP